MATRHYAHAPVSEPAGARRAGVASASPLVALPPRTGSWKIYRDFPSFRKPPPVARGVNPGAPRSFARVASPAQPFRAPFLPAAPPRRRLESPSMTKQEWEARVERTRLVRSRPNRIGEVSVYRRDPDGELRFERTERVPQPAAGPIPLASPSAISLR